MPPFWRESCLLLALLGLPVGLAAFCLGCSRWQQGRLLSYFAYYLLFGFAGQWLLAAALWPSGISRTMLGFLLTAAPVASLVLAVLFHRGPSRTRFDTGAMAACYLYPALVVAGVAMNRAAIFG